ncbi:hypothetical protein N665_0383s0047 [Sinapis alba]|nr:hypothetical protein N665_0383s0047 [Sinapis alba]
MITRCGIIEEIKMILEHLTNAKKQCAFLSDRDKYGSKGVALHCIAMRLMEERMAHLEKYTDAWTATPPELDDLNIYKYAIFLANVNAAPVVKSKEPWKHVFHVVTTIGAMQVMLKLKDYNGAHVEV